MHHLLVTEKDLAIVMPRLNNVRFYMVGFAWVGC